jgi:PAS domain S-box-containing protein
MGNDGYVYTEGLIYDMTWRKRLGLCEKTARKCAESFRTLDDLPAIGRWLRDRLSEVIPASNLMIALWDQAANLVTFPVAFDEADPPPPPRRPARYMIDYIINTGRGFHLNNAAHRTELTQAGYAPAGTPSADWLGVPLKDGKRILGVLSVQTYKPGEQYLSDDLHLLDELSVSIARHLADLRVYQAVRESMRRHHALFDALPMLAVYGCDADGLVFYWNTAAAASYGYSHDEVVGKFLWPMIVPEERREDLREAFREMARTKTPVASGEQERMRRDGTRVTVNTTYFLFENENGEPQLYSLDQVVSGTKASGNEPHHASGV